MIHKVDTMAWAATGMYTIPEAARLVGTNATRIRRWLMGYRFPLKGGRQGESAPLFPAQLPVLENKLAIGFLDLVELLFIKAFREFGVPLPTIRCAAAEASRRWNTDHPFCLNRLKTDGRSIFASLQDEEGRDLLLELTKSQYCFYTVINPYLKQLEYDAIGDVQRWWPLGKSKPVLVDPKVSFGRPILQECSIPTEAVFQAVRVNESETEVANWFGISLALVRAAIEFEKSRAA